MRLPATAVLAVLFCANTSAQNPNLKIVVVEGEGAVNIVRQGTATAPVVEVRDRNDQPVAGAIVTFAIRGGRATFSGGRTLSITTNAVGRAAATGLTPTSSGALQISASAAFQGQTAAATIVQTNVMTAAQAAAAAGGASGASSSAGGATGAAGGGAGGSAGGVSAATLGIVGGAVAGGTLVATQVAGDGEETATRYTARLTGDEDLFFGGNFCRTESITATLTMDLTVTNDIVTGVASIEGSTVVTRVSAGCTVFLNVTDGFGIAGAAVTGGPGSISFFKSQTNNVPPSATDPQGTVNTQEVTFTGALSGDVITGTLFSRRIVGGIVAGTHTFAVTARR